ncbi:hypothetical protein [Microcoleus sp. bin38.metabat.b11b12b14.051]|nr:hypothetical protein [Microcoleus sp. bin38.metabat.b11b12b14.051]
MLVDNSPIAKSQKNPVFLNLDRQSTASRNLVVARTPQPGTMFSF